MASIATSTSRLASFRWDPTGTQLTIDYNHLSGDTYRLTLFAGGFQDLVGHAVEQ